MFHLIIDIISELLSHSIFINQVFLLSFQFYVIFFCILHPWLSLLNFSVGFLFHFKIWISIFALLSQSSLRRSCYLFSFSWDMFLWSISSDNEVCQKFKLLWFYRGLFITWVSTNGINDTVVCERRPTLFQWFAYKDLSRNCSLSSISIACPLLLSDTTWKGVSMFSHGCKCVMHIAKKKCYRQRPVADHKIKISRRDSLQKRIINRNFRCFVACSDCSLHLG